MSWECLNCKKRAYAFAGAKTVSVCMAYNFANNGYAFREVEPQNDGEWNCPRKEKMTGEPFRYIKQLGNLLYCTETLDIVDGFGNPMDEVSADG